MSLELPSRKLRKRARLTEVMGLRLARANCGLFGFYFCPNLKVRQPPLTVILHDRVTVTLEIANFVFKFYAKYVIKWSY